LLDAKVMEQKRQMERELIRSSGLGANLPTGAKVRGEVDDEDLKWAPGPWEAISRSQDSLREIEELFGLLETGHAYASELFAIARHLVRLAEELPKNSTDRLREYRDSNLESLKFQLFSPAPLYPDLERVKLATGMTFLAERLGPDSRASYATEKIFGD